jgi:hypothetical protein
MTSMCLDKHSFFQGGKLPASILRLLAVGMLLMTSCSREDASQLAVPGTWLVDFRNAWNEAEQNPGTLADFYCWDGLQEVNRLRILRSLQFDADTPIASLRLEPWDPGSDPSRFFSPGMHPNLSPEGVLVIDLKTNPPTRYRQPIGRQHGHWLIIHAIPAYDEPS